MPRFDLFTSIHKAIRAMVYETGRALQTADFADGASAAGAVDRLEPVLVLLAEHHETEEQFVFPGSCRSSRDSSVSYRRNIRRWSAFSAPCAERSTR